MSGRERLAPLVAVVAAALVAYLGFACPFVLGGDQGEFTALFTLGGVAHPPGYPLWTLLLRAMSWMPGSNPSLAAARATAVVGAIAVGVLFAACRSWRASRGASVVACVVYAFAPLTWIYATQAEVFALNALLCSALLAVTGPECTLRGERRIVPAGLVVGLGLSHHPTFLAMGPIAILALVRGWREMGDGGRVRSSLLGAAALVLGLAPYDYVVWASHNPQGLWVWGGPMDPAGLLRHVLRIDFWQPAAARDTRGLPCRGRTFRLSRTRSPSPRWWLACPWRWSASCGASCATAVAFFMITASRSSPVRRSSRCSSEGPSGSTRSSSSGCTSCRS